MLNKVLKKEEEDYEYLCRQTQCGFEQNTIRQPESNFIAGCVVTNIHIYNAIYI